MYGVFFQKFLGMQPAMATQFYKWSDDWAMKQFNSVRTWRALYRATRRGWWIKKLCAIFFPLPFSIMSFPLYDISIKLLAAVVLLLLGSICHVHPRHDRFPLLPLLPRSIHGYHFFWQSFVAFHPMSLLFVVDHFLNGLEWSWVEYVFMYINL